MAKKKNYPEEIYPGDTGILGDKAKCTPKILDIEYAYDLGRAHGKEKSDTLKGFSNLTQAIQDGTRIDWELLNGRKAKCVHPELGTLTHKMVRDKSRDLESHEGWWWPYSFQRAWVEAFTCGWRGENGWSLWIEGDIPLKLPTADKLEPGSVFVGKNLRITEPTEFVVAHSTYADEEDITVAYPLGVIGGDCFYASGVDVIEVKSGGFLDG